MLLKEAIEKSKNSLNEGVVILKNSKRINNLVKKIKSKIQDEEKAKEIIPVIERLETASKEFEEVEKLHKENKEEAGKKYKELKEKYKDVVKRINSDTFKKILAGLGLAALGVSIGMAVKYYFDNNNPGQIFGRSLTREELFEQHIKKLCAEYGIPESLVYSIIQKESQWNHRAVGRNRGSRDIGLMQLNTRYTDWLADKFWDKEEQFDAFNPFHNVEVGIKYLDWLRDYFSGDWAKAIMGYNAGPNAVRNNNIPRSTRNYHRDVDREWKNGAEIPTDIKLSKIEV